MHPIWWWWWHVLCKTRVSRHRRGFFPGYSGLQPPVFQTLVNQPWPLPQQAWVRESAPLGGTSGENAVSKWPEVVCACAEACVVSARAVGRRLPEGSGEDASQETLQQKTSKTGAPETHSETWPLWWGYIKKLKTPDFDSKLAIVKSDHGECNRYYLDDIFMLISLHQRTGLCSGTLLCCTFTERDYVVSCLQWMVVELRSVSVDMCEGHSSLLRSSWTISWTVLFRKHHLWPSRYVLFELNYNVLDHI